MLSVNIEANSGAEARRHYKFLNVRRREVFCEHAAHVSAVVRDVCSKAFEMDPLGFEPRAFRMRSGCDTTTP